MQYHCCASVVPAQYQHSTGVVPALCARSAGAVPCRYQCSTMVLPVRYQRSTRAIPTGYQCSPSPVLVQGMRDQHSTSVARLGYWRGTVLLQEQYVPVRYQCSFSVGLGPDLCHARSVPARRQVSARTPPGPVLSRPFRRKVPGTPRSGLRAASRRPPVDLTRVPKRVDPRFVPKPDAPKPGTPPQRRQLVDIAGGVRQRLLDVAERRQILAHGALLPGPSRAVLVQPILVTCQ